MPTPMRRRLSGSSNHGSESRSSREAAVLREYWNADFGRELTAPPGCGM
jgi:hypothetical protein